LLVNDTVFAPGLDSAIEAAADSLRLYQTAHGASDNPDWKLFVERMALRRETLVHRLRLLAQRETGWQDPDELAGWRSRLGELSISVRGLISDPVKSSLRTIEIAETRLVDSLGAIGIATADPDELVEIVRGVTEERDVLRGLAHGADWRRSWSAP
jgi:hypothetical protein